MQRREIEMIEREKVCIDKMNLKNKIQLNTEKRFDKGEDN